MNQHMGISSHPQLLGSFKKDSFTHGHNSIIRNKLIIEALYDRPRVIIKYQKWEVMSAGLLQ